MTGLCTLQHDYEDDDDDAERLKAASSSSSSSSSISWKVTIYLSTYLSAAQFQLVHGLCYVHYPGEITKREIRQQIVFLIKIIDGH